MEDSILLKKFNIKGVANMWVIYALLSAFFAALTSILAKIGIENINTYCCSLSDGLGNSFY